LVDIQSVIDGVPQTVRAHEWDVASFEISPSAVEKISDSIFWNRLMVMSRVYKPVLTIHDGTQWMLLIKQGGEAKRVYFDNHFPWRITSFAEELDEAVGLEKLAEVEWKPLPEGEGRKDERELWGSGK
jgi:hypothetical protein